MQCRKTCSQISCSSFIPKIPPGLWQLQRWGKKGRRYLCLFFSVQSVFKYGCPGVQETVKAFHFESNFPNSAPWRTAMKSLTRHSLQNRGWSDELNGQIGFFLARLTNGRHSTRVLHIIPFRGDKNCACITFPGFVSDVAAAPPNNPRPPPPPCPPAACFPPRFFEKCAYFSRRRKDRSAHAPPGEKYETCARTGREECPLRLATLFGAREE